MIFLFEFTSSSVADGIRANTLGDTADAIENETHYVYGQIHTDTVHGTLHIGSAKYVCSFIR